MLTSPKEKILAPRGLKLSCEGWPQETALRLLMNNLEVAEKPEELIVYGGRGQAARNWDCYYRIIEILKKLKDDETLIIQSGKPVAVFRTHEWAPRVLFSNGMLVPAWSTAEHFDYLYEKGLIMFGQMTAGSWINIGSQGIVQGTYETFAAIAKLHFEGTLEGKLTLTGGLGMFSGIMPYCISMNGGVSIAVEIDPRRIDRRVELGFVDEVADDNDDALKRASEYQKKGIARSIAVLGNAADVFEYYLEKDVPFHVVTDQTSAHDLFGGYVPSGYDIYAAERLRIDNPKRYVKEATETVVRHVKAMDGFVKKGVMVFDYGNNIRQQAFNAGFKDAFSFPGFVKAFLRPLFCEGRGPFRWVCLSGDEEDLRKTEKAALREFPDDPVFSKWIKIASEKQPIEGLPARLGYLGYGQRAHFGSVLNDMVRTGELKAPVAIGRDHLDTGSVASPNRETEGMLDETDAVADWPILNSLLNTACGATTVAVHNGGGVGIGYATHAGLVVLADGTDLAEQKINRALTADPGIGVVRHADAGYDLAIKTAMDRGINMPMLRHKK
jgi:urocanate hydratase